MKEHPADRIFGIDFKNILDHLGQAVFIYDRKGKIIYVNDYLLQNSIYTQEEILAGKGDTFFEQGQTDINIYQVVKKRKCQVTAIQTFRNLENNVEQKAIVRQTPIIDKNGEISMIVGMITRLDTIEAEKKLIRQSPDHIFIPSFRNSKNKEGRAEKPIYKSAAMEKIISLADAVADSTASVLIRGESGVGKDVIARYVHAVSGRSSQPFIPVNCGAISETLIDSELFGYAQGAFTGANAKGRKGLIEEANGGTLFLDEIDSIPLSVQAKLLRTLETHEIRMVGSNKIKKIDFRILAATNADLEEKVRNHEFREDLYYRLNIVPIYIPPLRARQEDIEVLAKYFLDFFNVKYGRNSYLSDEVLMKLRNYNWPGNVRELRNVIERLVLVMDSSVGMICDIPSEFLEAHFSDSRKEKETAAEKEITAEYRERAGYGSASPEQETGCEIPLRMQVAQLEKSVIRKAIEKYGSLGKAAKALGMSKSTLIRKRDQ